MGKIQAQPGRLHTLASGRLSFEMSEAGAEEIFGLAEVVAGRFGMQPALPIFGLDGTYIELRRGELLLTVGWDIWSGCFVMAHTPEGDGLVRQLLVSDGGEDSMSRRTLVISQRNAATPEIGRWVWAMEDARSRTLERLEGVDPALVDWEPAEGGNSVGSILYHIAAIEADYLYADLMQVPFPQQIVELFPYEVREEDGLLTPVRGFDLGWYLHRLRVVRGELLAYFDAMDMADFQRPRPTGWADISPDWTLHHLLQHEAEHRAELSALRARAAAPTAGGA